MGKTMTLLAVGALALAACEAGGRPQGDAPGPRTHQLKATPKTVAWGYYDAKAKPVLRIRSGDTVEVQTLITNSPQGLERAFLPPAQVEQALRDVFKEVTDKGPGGHILTGPIHVEGAEPGDTLEVRIRKVKLALPYSYNGFSGISIPSAKRATMRFSSSGMIFVRDRGKSSGIKPLRGPKEL